MPIIQADVRSYQERTLRMPAAFFENELQYRALNMNRSRSLYFDKMFIV
jgi:hypothetical protein